MHLKNSAKARFILLSVFFIAYTMMASVVFAQQGRSDKLYLKNGSIINGRVTDFAPERPLKIKLADGVEMEYKWEQIDKIEFANDEPRVTNQADDEERERRRLYWRGSRGITLIGGTVLVRSTTISGVNKDWEAGIGGGFQGWAQTYFARQWAVISGLGINAYGSSDLRGYYLSTPILFRFVTNQLPDKLGVNFDFGFNNNFLISSGDASPKYSRWSRSLVLGVGVVIPVTKQFTLNTMLHSDFNIAGEPYASYAGIGVQMGVFYRFYTEPDDD